MTTDEGKMKEYQEIIRRILSAFGNIPFYIIVESTMGVKVEPYSKDNQNDLLLSEEIGKIADRLTQTYNKNNIDENLYERMKGHRPTNFRNNEAAVLIEEIFVSTFEKVRSELRYVKEVEHLGQRGYPDTRIVGVDGRVTYLEIKATTRPNEGSPRDFYFTPLEMAKAKITSSAHHFVIGFVMIEARPKVFHTVGWKLVDLYKINVSMKPEFNCDNRELYKRDALISENFVEMKWRDRFGLR